MASQTGRVIVILNDGTRFTHSNVQSTVVTDKFLTIRDGLFNHHYKLTAVRHYSEPRRV